MHLACDSFQLVVQFIHTHNLIGCRLNQRIQSILALLNKFFKIRTLIIGYAASRTIVCEGKDFALNFLYLLFKEFLCLIK